MFSAMRMGLPTSPSPQATVASSSTPTTEVAVTEQSSPSTATPPGFRPVIVCSRGRSSLWKGLEGREACTVATQGARTSCRLENTDALRSHSCRLDHTQLPTTLQTLANTFRRVFEKSECDFFDFFFTHGCIYHSTHAWMMPNNTS